MFLEFIHFCTIYLVVLFWQSLAPLCYANSICRRRGQISAIFSLFTNAPPASCEADSLLTGPLLAAADRHPARKSAASAAASAAAAAASTAAAVQWPGASRQAANHEAYR